VSKTLDYYEKHATELSAFYESTQLDSFHLALQEFFFPGARLIEIGCGSGRDAARVLAEGYEVEAIDGSRKLLDEAIRLHPELAGHLCQIQLPAILPYEDHQFDGFYSVACLMHFSGEELAGILTELHRITRPEGRGLVSVPACRDDVDFDGHDEHGRLFNVLPEQTWKAIFQQNGFLARAGNPEPDSRGRDGISWISFFLRRF
jgi:SAM-dependent methyltransferase